MLKTVLALVLSTGLAACMIDDEAAIETEELAENPDVLADDSDGVTAGNTGIVENPSDVPGIIPAPNRGTDQRVHYDQQSTTDVGLVRGANDSGQTVQTQESTQTHVPGRGVDGTTLPGREIGDTCDSKEMDCRTVSPQKRTY